MNRRLLVAASLALALLSGCSGQPDPATPADNTAAPPEAPAIEQYRSALESVIASQKALMLETARFNGSNWVEVAGRSSELADALHGSIEPLKRFEEVAPAASTLQGDVARLQRTLRKMDASTWQELLPDLVMITESIQSGMDELQDLAAEEPDPAIEADHHHEVGL
jgi:hypothetical protein